MRLGWLLAGTTLAACAAEIDLEGRDCAPGEPTCLEGYVCHPEREQCVCEIEIGCDGSQSKSCPQLTQTGDPCPCAGAYIECDVGAVTPCEHGCRTCGADLTWGACSEKSCDPGAPELCDRRDNDCDGLIDEGIFGCECAGGAPGSVEVCDQRDNDCNTAIDEGFECRFDSERPCEGGQGYQLCNPSTCEWRTECVAPGGQPGMVTDFVAQEQNASVQLSWVHPSDPGLDMCVVRRQIVNPPNHHLVGDLVHVEVDAAPGFARSVLNDGLTNGVRYAYAAFCRNDSGRWNDSVQIGVNAGDATPTAGPALNPTDFDASDGEDGQSTISFTLPANAVECRLRRKRNDSAVDYPGGHDEVSGSDLVVTIESQAQLPYVDDGLENGGAYYYAAFCFNGEEWNDSYSTTPGNVSADVALPLDPVPDNPADFDASDGEDSLSTLTFTMPAVEECQVRRRSDGAYPIDEDDGTLVAQLDTPGSKRIVDTGLTNGMTHYYAVYCKTGTTWNTTRSSANADTADPVDIAIAYEDHVARGTRESNVIVSDPVTFVDNRLYLVAVTTRPFVATTQVTGLGFTWELAVSQCGANNETGTEIWWAFGSPSGTSTQVRATLPTPIDGGVIAVLRYAGVNSGQPMDASAGANAAGGSCGDASAENLWQVAVAASADGVVVGSGAILIGESLPLAGVTELDEVRANTGIFEVAMALVEKPVGSAGTETVGGVLGATFVKWGAAAVALTP